MVEKKIVVGGQESKAAFFPSQFKFLTSFCLRDFQCSLFASTNVRTECTHLLSVEITEFVVVRLYFLDIFLVDGVIASRN